MAETTIPDGSSPSTRDGAAAAAGDLGGRTVTLVLRASIASHTMRTS
jgi:hypothetical protein